VLVILIVDPITTLAVDLRTDLHPELARPVFLQAVRYARGLVRTSEGAWEAYLEGRLLPREAEAVDHALEQHLGIEPEYARLTAVGLAYRRDTGEWRLKTLVASSIDEELSVIAEFWQIVEKSVRMHYQLVTYGGLRWGIPFIMRRSLLRGVPPSVPMPLARSKPDLHFDVSEILSNNDRTRMRPLELAAIQYGVKGPWDAPAEDDTIDTATGVRRAVGAGDLDRASLFIEARLSAIGHLHDRLVTTYMQAS
jgi:hypothetical protein